MKAVVYDKSLSPEFLALREVEKPLPRDHEVLVKIFAASINAADYRSMQLGIIPKRGIFGADIAGRVEAAGREVQQFKPGDDVFGDIAGCGFGGFAEYVAVPASALALKPASVSYQDAAALPMASVTALQALRDQGRIRPGQKVLIHGAGGGVGTFAVQLAKYFETEVTAVCGSGSIELVRALGADRVIDYTREDFSKSRARYDLLVAVNGNRPLPVYKSVLAPGGIFVMVGGALTQVIGTLLFGALMSLGSKKMRLLSAKLDVKDLELVIHLVEHGTIKPVIDRTYPLRETAQAMHYARQGHARGKVIIDVVST
jgi:NADPH:quinone reductase-like Zn-dependent oxidoreductase